MKKLEEEGRSTKKKKLKEEVREKVKLEEGGRSIRKTKIRRRRKKYEKKKD